MRRRTLAVLALLVATFFPVAANTINFGLAANYTVLGIGGTSSSNQSLFSLYQSDTFVKGPVGVGPYSVFGHGFDGTIQGPLNYDNTITTAPTVTGTITQGVHQMDMSQVVQDAIGASNAAAALTPTQTFTTLSENQVIVGNGGLNVIRVTSGVTLKVGLTLQGSPLDTFVFQLTSADKDPLTLSGMNMTLTGGVKYGNIIWNLNGTGGDVSITSMSPGQMVYGTFLAPYRNMTVDHGIIKGQVMAGGSLPGFDNFLAIHSSSQITPEPGSFIFGGTVLAGMTVLWFRRRRR